MKKYISLLIYISLICISGKAQTILYDGETISPDLWDLGGNPPNGASCPSGEGWRLNVSGKMDILTEGLVNPISNGLNTTEKVVRFVRAQNGEGWAGAALNVTGLNLNIATTNKFSLLIYKEIAGNVTLKLEGNGSEEVTSYYNTPGQWQKLEFVFNAANFSGSPTTMIVMPHNQTPLSETIITYWDEVTMYDESDNPTVIYNGNDPVSGFFLDGYWAPNGSLNNLMTDVFPNLSKAGMNTSNHVMRFLRAKDGEIWCGMGLGGLNIDVAVTPIISLMINKPVSGRVGVKLEGNGSQEVYADYTTPGVWERLTFTFNSTNFSGNANTLIIFPHFEETNIINLVDHTPMYVDNVILRSSATLETDYFRSAVSGNWSNTGSWESSYNNSNWVSSNLAPGSVASSVSIMNGQLITVDDNVSTTEITVNAGAKLTLNSGKSLHASTIHLLSDAMHGTGTFVDKGTFTADSAIVQQYLSGGRNWYISSPVSAAKRSSISTASQVVSYNEATANWDTESENADLIPMKGYIAVSPTAGNIEFRGTLNTGEIPISLDRHTGVAKEGFQLVGNPYPSYVDFASATRTNLSTTIWYRTKNGSNYVFDTYNASSNLGTSNNNNELIPVTGKIAPMQAFWVRALAGGGTLAFDNSMRSHLDQSIATNRLKVPAQIDNIQQVLRLQVSNGTNRDEAILLFNPEASNGLDDYDSPKMSNDKNYIPEIYTFVDNEKIVINGMQNLPFDTEIPIGFTTGENSEFEIKIIEKKNFKDDVHVFLRDKILNNEQELTVGNAYNFSSEAVKNSLRFSIVFKSTSVTTGSLQPNANGSLNIYNHGSSIVNISFPVVVNSTSKLTITNLLGQPLFYTELNNRQNEIKTDFASGVYIVRVVCNGNTISSKVLFN